MGKKIDDVRSEEPFDAPLAAWFLGPKAEQAPLWNELLTYIFQDYVHWRRNYFPNDPVVISRERRREHERWWDELNGQLDAILNALKAHYPFYSPRYIAHMLSEQTLPSVLGYFAGLLYNPNNVTDEAAPVTVRLELEVGRMVAEMLGYNPRKSWAHLCSGGTIANAEAFWVARTVQFVPFIIREYCAKEKIPFAIKTPNGEQAQLTDLSDALLLSLRPNESIFMTRKLARFEVDTLGRDDRRVLARLNDAIRNSAFNVRARGFATVSSRLGVRPLIFASAAAHYSIKKACNLIGYGEDAVKVVPVTQRFRMDVSALKEAIMRIRNTEYVAAVVGIAGTTEEGAVDSIHSIAESRDQLCSSENSSFWLHVDAAWGGYMRSVFRGNESETDTAADLDELCRILTRTIDASEKVTPLTGGKQQTLTWDDPEVYKAFIAMREAESITIDPHKMGYVPYPAGIVAFKNGLVTELLTQRAQYISDEREGLSNIDEPVEIQAVGPYVLEGSKPGFVATGCWLAHKTIPLTRMGHGKIVKTTLLNTKKLHWYLTQHRKGFVAFERRCGFVPVEGRYDVRLCPHPFTFQPMYNPDTNIVCFVMIPMKWKNGRLDVVDFSLGDLNRLTRELHEKFDIPQGHRGSEMPYHKEFFVSRTSFEKEQYVYSSLKPILAPMGIDEGEYNREGIVVLRSTVMNPLYYTALGEGIDYLQAFVVQLHRCGRKVMGN